MRASFNVTMPIALPTDHRLDLKVFGLAMRLLIADVTIRISSAATRPPPILLERVCEMTPLTTRRA